MTGIDHSHSGQSVTVATVIVSGLSIVAVATKAFLFAMASCSAMTYSGKWEVKQGHPVRNGHIWQRTVTRGWVTMLARHYGSTSGHYGNDYAVLGVRHFACTLLCVYVTGCTSLCVYVTGCTSLCFRCCQRQNLPRYMGRIKEPPHGGRATCSRRHMPVNGGVGGISVPLPCMGRRLAKINHYMKAFRGTWEEW